MTVLAARSVNTEPMRMLLSLETSASNSTAQHAMQLIHTHAADTDALKLCVLFTHG